jgi:hypothetical protein
MTIEFELHDHIATFDGAFSSDYCNKIIDFFEYRSVYLPAYNRESSWYKDSAISVGDDYDFLYDKGYVTQMFSELNSCKLFGINAIRCILVNILTTQLAYQD